MSRIPMTAVAACCLVALFSRPAVAAGDAQCWHPYEVEAAKVRDLHIMLMLGALKCKSTSPATYEKYSSFLDKKGSLLTSYNNVLKTRFMRANGISEGERTYQEFNTRLGNSHSGITPTRSYCQTTDTLLMLAIDAPDQHLPQLAQSFSESPLGIDTVCEAAATPVVAGTSSPEPAPVGLAKTDSPTDPQQSAAAALEAAAAALQTAAASLKAQTPAPVDGDTSRTMTEPAPIARPAIVQPVSTTAQAPAG